MISFDTNILLYSLIPSSPYFKGASSFLKSIVNRDDVVLSEFVLFELYSAIRNPTIFDKPLKAAEAHALIQNYRNHPRWLIVGFPENSKLIHDKIWQYASNDPKISRSKIFDLRLAFTLQAFGVKEFTTMNQKDFINLGFITLHSLSESSTKSSGTQDCF